MLKRLKRPVVNQVFMSRSPCGALGGDPGYFTKTIVREILSLPTLDRLQDQAGNDSGLSPSA
jgi:hypothetical protein